MGSADHHIHYYDLRNVSAPVHVFSGHRKAVSYVKFLSTRELASASTDSTLRLWDVNENCAVCVIMPVLDYPIFSVDRQAHINTLCSFGSSFFYAWVLKMDLHVKFAYGDFTVVKFTR